MIKILLTFSETYAPHAAAVITGLIKHSSTPLAFTVLHRDVSEECIRKFVDFYLKMNVHIDFVRVDIPQEIIEIIDKIESQGHLKGMYDPYLRLFACQYVLDDEVVYLDCDIVVNGDISKMLDEVDHSKFICAVKEHDPMHKMNKFSSLDKFQRPISLEEYMIRDAYFFRLKNYYHMNMTSSYFCDGVMYMNLKKWRDEKLLDRIISRMKETTLFVSADQDVLNSVIDGDYGVLSPKWNSFVTSQGIMLNYTTSELEEAVYHPMIVHMPGVAKPWNKNMGGKYREIYWEYRKETPWPESYRYPWYKRYAFFTKRVYNKLVRTLAKILLSILIIGREKEESASSIFAKAYLK